jgi:GntR family transcriptional regulator / MocR family aminotransferase
VSEPWATSGLDLLVRATPGRRRASLEEDLREAARTGRLAPGDRLPSTRVLAADLGLSRGTVTAAYDQLVAEGYLVTRRGLGTLVGDVVTAQRPLPAAAAAAGPRLDMRPGTPDVETFPVAAWLRAGRRALSAAPRDTFAYGDQRGRAELRRALADYLGRTRGVLADPDRIIVTTGYVQALSLLGRALSDAGRARVAMEDPCFWYHRQVVRRSGATVVALPVDERGARVDLLDSLGADAVVVTPAHQYPSGVTLHPERRRVLIAWARATGGVVIEDDYDGEFRYDRQPVGALQGTATDHVAYVGTVSKSLGPGVRLGWIVLPPSLVEPVAEAKLYADHSTDAISQLTLAEMIATHAFDRHLRSCRLRYRRRRDRLVDALEPDHRVAGVAAGLHALVRLPAGGPTEREVVDRAAASGLALEGLSAHWHGPGDRPAGIVVGYARPPERSFPEAVGSLRRALGEWPTESVAQ